MSDRPTARFLAAFPGYARAAGWPILAGSACAIVSNLAVVTPPILLGRALDAVVAWRGGRLAAGAAGLAVAAWAGAVALVEVPRIGRRWWLGISNNRIRTRIRRDAVEGVLGWPLERLHGSAVGDLMARIVGDVEALGVGVKTLTQDTWDTLWSAVVTLATLLWLDPTLTLEAVAPMPVAMLLAHASGRWVRARVAASRRANAALTAALQERITAIRLLRSYGRGDAAVDRLRALASEQADANVAVVRLREGLAPLYGVIMTSGIVLVVWLGGRRAAAGAMTVGAFVAYLQLFLRFATRGHRVPRFLNRIQGAAAAWERIEPLVERRPAPTATDSAGRAPVGPVAVELRGATLRYPGAAGVALRDVSLALPAGSLTGVTGPVGCGKSALARAVLGLLPLEAGTVAWDGRGVHEWPAPARAVRSGYLPQDPGLFAGSVRENILLRWTGAGSADDRDPAPVAAHAALAEDLAGFPSGIDTEIGETGIRVSGGQRQRIALARALAVALPGAPGLLVLDDPFAAVDPETEARIVRSLVERHGSQAPADRRATILLLSHRLAAFPLCDRVVTLAGGEIRETGTHASLVRADGPYARIVAAQTRLRGDGGR